MLPETENEVINHLLFHKSLTEENQDMDRINHYIEMVKKTNRGEHIAIENPFDRSIALTFELVLQNHLDPWNIDLVNFSSMYLKRAKKEKVDLITAGRIIYLAWKILKLQSNYLVTNIESETEKIDESDVFTWDDIPFSEMWLTEKDDYSYTNIIMKTPKPPLNEPIRRVSKRKVTLIELLNAFKEAKNKAEQRLLLEKIRQQEKEKLAEKARQRMRGTAHEDHLEKDITLVWEKIKNIPKKTISLTDLCEKNNREEIIKTILSLLFLANDNKIKIYQKNFPFGKIYAKKT